MQFIIEFDGPVADLAPVHFAAFSTAAHDVGWSALDQRTYWRSIRTKGSQANILPGIRPAKRKAFDDRFAAQLEEADTWANAQSHPEMDDTLRVIAHHGAIIVATLGSNVAARRALFDRQNLSHHILEMQPLSRDPRRRPIELKALAAGDPRTVVAASSETILRAAREVDLLTIGIASGACAAPRLHQAGADIVYRDLIDLAESLRTGAADLIEAGLRPPTT